MIYVMSDIHGQKRRFDSVMKQINLQPDDTLYILGDVIDRNPDGIKILRQIMAMPNAKMLLGNHELMMMNALYYPSPEDEEWPEYYYERKQSLWYRNGGQITHDYLKHIRKTTRQEIFEYLEKLPINIELTLNNRKFILTHAAPAELYETYGRKYECERDFAVWMRFDSFPVLEDCTVIFGHTPTIRFQYDNPLAIWDAKSWIGIDCGCMLPEKGDPWSGALGRLSCLRLDDMQVFYSEEPQYDNLKESEEQHDGKVTITIEIDAELLAQVTEVLKPYGLTPEEAAVQFFEYCAAPKTQDHAIKLLKKWKEEQEAQERNSANAK